MRNYLRLLWAWSPPVALTLALLVVLGIGLAIAHLTAPAETAARLTPAQQRAARQAIEARSKQLRADTLAAARYDTLAAHYHRAATRLQRAADSLTRLTHPTYAAPTRPVSAAEQLAADKLITDY